MNTGLDEEIARAEQENENAQPSQPCSPWQQSPGPCYYSPGTCQPMGYFIDQFQPSSMSEQAAIDAAMRASLDIYSNAELLQWNYNGYQDLLAVSNYARKEVATRQLECETTIKSGTYAWLILVLPFLVDKCRLCLYESKCNHLCSEELIFILRLRSACKSWKVSIDKWLYDTPTFVSCAGLKSGNALYNAQFLGNKKHHPKRCRCTNTAFRGFLVGNFSLTFLRDGLGQKRNRIMLG
ncbi:hypothetical protein Pelo_2895 [Pelomyxa schiedti]|nr:hypothetical protein Pelo_2895 [Pelomyxa schiedti]